LHCEKCLNTERRAACVATSGPSLGRKRPRRAAISGGRYRIPLAKTIAISGSIERKGSRTDTKVYARPKGRALPQWVICRHGQPKTGMSASPLKADIRASSQHVRYGPTGDIAGLALTLKRPPIGAASTCSVTPTSPSAKGAAHSVEASSSVRLSAAPLRNGILIPSPLLSGCRASFEVGPLGRPRLTWIPYRRCLWFLDRLGIRRCH